MTDLGEDQEYSDEISFLQANGEWFEKMTNRLKMRLHFLSLSGQRITVSPGLSGLLPNATVKGPSPKLPSVKYCIWVKMTRTISRG